MSVYGISGNAGLVAFRHRPYLQNMGATSSQTVDTSQGGQTVPQAAPADSQAMGGNSPAHNSFSALLGGMAAGGISQDGTVRSQGAGMLQPPPPTPGAEGGQGSSFGSSLMSLLQSVLSGDMTGAQSAAAAIQSALGGAVSPDSGAPASASSTSSSGTVSSMAPAAASAASAGSPATGPGAAQSEFMTGLNGLLTAVQSGDQASSKTAAAALIFAMSAQQDGLGLPQPASDAGAFRNNLASLLRSVQTGDMAGAQGAATAIQNALNSTESQFSNGKPAAASSASAAPASITPSAQSTADAEQDSGRSTFMTDLKSLLAAVQSGDGTASKTAAAALLDGLKAQAEEFQTQLAGIAPLPSSSSQDSGVGNVLSAYFQWS